MGNINLVSVQCWAKSDIGKRRAHNEDSFYANEKEALFMVADGMGGHRGGDKASQLAIETASLTFKNSENKELKKAQALEEAFIQSAKEVYKAGNTYADLRGMGTTLSAMVIEGNNLYICHIGDSRIYYIRNNDIHRLTNDHSLVNEQIQAGLLNEEEARVSNLRNIITRAIGHKKIVDPDIFSFQLENNDLILLCTDGLNNLLLDDEIANIINNNTPQEAVSNLINEANEKGGDDNITVILVKVSY